MPVYEYICRRCGHRFEKLVRSMSSANESEKFACPKCDSLQTARTLSVFAVSSETKSQSVPTCGHCGGAPGSCRSN